MKEIKSYLSIIEPNLLNRLTGKTADLIQMVQENNFASEEALIQQICQGGKAKTYYNNLKSKALKILQCLAIVSTNSGANAWRKNFEACQKNFILGQKFHNEGIRQEGMKLIKKAYKTAREYEFTHLACELASVLYKDATHYQSNLKLADKYARELEFHMNNYIIEKKAEHYYFQMVAKMNKGKSIQAAEINTIHDKVGELDGASILYQVYYSLIGVHAGVYSNQYNEVVQRCDEALEHFGDKKGVYSSQIKFFYSKKGIALMALGKYEEAKKSFETGLYYAPRFSSNYYVTKLQLCINALHAGDYETSFELYRANRNCRFYFIQKQFAIIEAYLYFLSKKGHLSSSRFRIGKFLTETEGEKENINILIARLLVVLVQNQNDFMAEVDRMEDDLQQYFKLPGSKRAKQFLKILVTLAKADFDLTRVEHRVSNQVNFLQSEPLALGDSLSFEIIPFQDLWDMIALKLKRKTA